MLKRLEMNSGYYRVTALIAHFKAPFQDVAAKLGIPDNPPCDKTSTEWVVEFEGDVFTVYDYRMVHPKGRLSVEQLRDGRLVEWHVGFSIQPDKRERFEKAQRFVREVFGLEAIDILKTRFGE